jgi:transcriptional regulator with XRE-family HTH domain
MAGNLGARIRILRQQRGMAPASLAQAAGVTRSWLSRLERGLIPEPDVTELQRLAHALTVPLTDLLRA